MQKWTDVHEVKDLQSFDIGIMPLTDTPTARGKCGGKLLQYGGCGIPSVASPVGVNSEIISDGKNGFLTSSSRQWITKLSLLMESERLRRTFGLKLRKTVEKRYSVDAHLRSFIATLKDATR